MTREQMIKDRDAYLKKLNIELKDRHPNALSFYDNPKNFTPPETPNWPIKQNSKKGLEKTKKVLSDSELIHLLRRTKAGISREEYNTFQTMNVEEIVELLLTEEVLADPVNDYNDPEEDIFDEDIAFGESFAEAEHNDELEGSRVMSIKGWIVQEVKKTSTSMHSNMWLFWQNHIVTELWGVFNGRFNFSFLKLLHDYSFGNFKELMYLVSKEPSMLLYLNGIYNSKDAPDENFGRELQELFCIGKGPNAGYTEGDVQAAARVMTGWSLDWDTFDQSAFNTWDHETADKQFSAFYDNTLIEGKEGEDGQNELQEMIDMIFNNDEVSHFIVRKLYTYFVFSTIDEWTEENVITPLAQTFRDNEYNLKPVLQQLFNSAHFYDEINYGAIIKNPVDMLTGWWRTMDIQVPFDESDDILNKYYTNRSMMWYMGEWGMELGDPPNVAGWPAYYQFPTFDKTWITTNTITRRISFIDNFMGWGMWTPYHVITFDILEFVKSLDEPGNPNTLLDQMEKFFLGIPLLDDVKSNIKSILLSGQEQDYYWTDAWSAFLMDETNEVTRAIVKSRLDNTFRRIFSLSEFQLK